MVSARSAGASVSPAAAMVMNTRANACDGAGIVPGAGGFAFGSGGSSEGLDPLLRARPALHRPPNGGRRQVERAPRARDRQRRGIESRRRPAWPQHIADIDERRDRDRREYDERQQKLTALLAPTTPQMPAALLADANRGHERRSRPCESVAAHQSSIIRRRCVLAPALQSPIPITDPGKINPCLRMLW